MDINMDHGISHRLIGQCRPRQSMMLVDEQRAVSSTAGLGLMTNDYRYTFVIVEYLAFE